MGESILDYEAFGSVSYGLALGSSDIDLVMHGQPGHNLLTIWQEVAYIARRSPQFSDFPRDEDIDSWYDTIQFMFRGVWVDLKCCKLHRTQDRALRSSSCMRRAMASKSQSFCDIVLAFKLILHHHNLIRHHKKKNQGGLPKGIAMACFAIAVLSIPHNVRRWGLDEGILDPNAAAVSATDGYLLLGGLLREFADFQWKDTAIFVTDEGACSMMPKPDASEPCAVLMEAQQKPGNPRGGNATSDVRRMNHCQRIVKELLEQKSARTLLREALDDQKLEEKFSHLKQFEGWRRFQADSAGDGLQVDSMDSPLQADSVGAVSSGGAGANQISDPSSPLSHLPPPAAHQQLHWNEWAPSMVSPPPSHAMESTNNIGFAPMRPVLAASNAASGWGSSSVAPVRPLPPPKEAPPPQEAPPQPPPPPQYDPRLNDIGCALSPPMASPRQSYVAAAASAWDWSSNCVQFVPAPIPAAGAFGQCLPPGGGLLNHVDGFTQVPLQVPVATHTSDYTIPPPPPPVAPPQRYPTGHPSFMDWVENGHKPFEPGFYHIEDDDDGACVEVIVNAAAVRDPRAPIVVMVPGTDGFNRKGYSGYCCIEVRIHCHGKSKLQSKSAKPWKRPAPRLVRNALVTVRRWADSDGDASARERRHVGVIAFSRGASWMMTFLSESSALVDFAWLIAGCLTFCFCVLIVLLLEFS